ncbi:MAG: hypothetical protein GY761_03540, partial [Hyphomicrobiales bacterium]|nr:hypothetical protein [Hyphomicrobiales bacterium]
MLDWLFPNSGLPDLFVLYIALGFAVAALLFAAVLIVLKFKKQRDHINRRILPMEQNVTPQNAVYLLSNEGDGVDGFGFNLPVKSLDNLILYAGLKLSAGRLIFLMAVIFTISIAAV